MNFKDKKNLTQKTLQERYARIMGSDWQPQQPPPTSQQTKRNFLLWIALFLILMVLLTGILYFINIQTEITEDHVAVPTKPDLQEKQNIPSIPELPPISVDDSDGGDKSAASDSLISEKIESTVTDQQVDQEKLQNTDNQTISPAIEYKIEPIDPNQFFVIVQSTISKDEAIKQAIAMGAKGYLTEVILSSNGYYGVVLGRFGFDDAKQAIKEAVASGSVTKKPYLMAPDRVKEYVYSVVEYHLSE